MKLTKIYCLLIDVVCDSRDIVAQEMKSYSYALKLEVGDGKSSPWSLSS